MNETKETAPQSSNTGQRAEIERELRLVKEYWLQTVQPQIAGRRLRDVELFVAKDAYLRLRGAERKAEDWNRTSEGRLSPLDADLSGENFCEPEILFADENLKPEILAEIAAPLINKSDAKMSPAEAVRNAHELLMAAERYIGTLPKQKGGIESIVSDFNLAFNPVSFAEILRSNEKTAGQLPLLRPVQQGRNEGKLSLSALRTAVKEFYKKEKASRPQITEEQYNRQKEQTAKLIQEGKVMRMGSGKPMTYQEWQSQPDETIKDCLQNNRIVLQALCMMRWERFKDFRQNQESRTQKREPSESKLPKKEKSKANLPHSAASSPTTAGKRKK